MIPFLSYLVINSILKPSSPNLYPYYLLDSLYVLHLGLIKRAAVASLLDVIRFIKTCNCFLLHEKNSRKHIKRVTPFYFVGGSLLLKFDRELQCWCTIKVVVSRALLWSAIITRCLLHDSKEIICVKDTILRLAIHMLPIGMITLMNRVRRILPS